MRRLRRRLWRMRLVLALWRLRPVCRMCRGLVGRPATAATCVLLSAAAGQTAVDASEAAAQRRTACRDTGCQIGSPAGCSVQRTGAIAGSTCDATTHTAAAGASRCGAWSDPRLRKTRCGFPGTPHKSKSSGRGERCARLVVPASIPASGKSCSSPPRALPPMITTMPGDGPAHRQIGAFPRGEAVVPAPRREV